MTDYLVAQALDRLATATATAGNDVRRGLESIATAILEHTETLRDLADTEGMGAADIAATNAAGGFGPEYGEDTDTAPDD